MKSKAPLRAESEILKIGDKRQPAGSFSLFVDFLKNGRPIEADTPKIGFSRYFHTLKKNLAGKSGLFKKSRLGESGIGPMKVSQFREFLFGKRNWAGEIYLPKVIILPGQFGLQSLVKGAFIFFRH